MTIFNYIEPCSDGRNYIIHKTMCYYSQRYSKLIVARVGDVFDGATGAFDIDTRAWIFHDILCRDGFFNDGTPCTNWQASLVLKDILAEDGKWFRQYTWFAATWIFGGGRARDNGLF